MVARWLSQKLDKQKRMKRAYLRENRTFGVSVSKITAYEIYQNKNRLKSLSKGSGIGSRKITNLASFTQEVPVTQYSLYNTKSKGWEPNLKKLEEDEEFLKFYYEQRLRRPKPTMQQIVTAWKRLPKQDTNDRKHDEIAEEYKRLHRSFLLDTLHEVWQGKRHQGVTDYNSVKLKGVGEDSLVLYFSGNEWLFVLSVEGQRWISKTYHGREQAYSVYEQSKIIWIRQEPITQQ